MGTVYLIHVDGGLSQGPDPRTGKERRARHYLGWARDLDGRMAAHQAGNGSRFMAEVMARRLTWRLARTWDDQTRCLEAQLKRRRSPNRLCPECTKGATR